MYIFLYISLNIPEDFPVKSCALLCDGWWYAFYSVPQNWLGHTRYYFLALEDIGAWHTVTGESLCRYFVYFSIAMIKYHDQNNL